jgi:hypothetical protein
MTNPQPNQVPVNAKNRVKVISSADPVVFEKDTNSFLDTISDERLLASMNFFNVDGKLTNVIYYRDISPMTRENWAKKLETQKKFAAGFIPNDLMPSGETISKL